MASTSLTKVSRPDQECIGKKIAKFDFVYETKTAKGDELKIHIPEPGVNVLAGIEVDIYMSSSSSTVWNSTSGEYYHNYRLKLLNLSNKSIFVTCPEFEIKNESICGKSHLYEILHYEYVKKPLHFSVKIEIQPNPRKTMTMMYEDTEITDFELCAEDGSVKVHKVVLAVASPVFKAMLINDWKEKTEGRVEIPEISKETLECLKKYMYVQTIDKNVNVENLLQLLRLAKCYMMPDLEEDCSRLIEEKATEENFWSLFNTAFQNKYEQLLVILFQNVNSKRILAIEKEFCKPKDEVNDKNDAAK